MSSYGKMVFWSLLAAFAFVAFGPIAPASAAVHVTTTSLPNGRVGAAYSATMHAIAGHSPYTWRVYTGSLPPGLSIAESGAISGTPTTAGTSNFTVRAYDSVFFYDDKALSIAVGAAPLSITTSGLSAGLIGAEYSQALTAQGGVTPYAWSLGSGSLPDGLSLDAAAGVISGTPTASGVSSFTVVVTDSNSPAVTATKALSITVADNFAIVTVSLSDGQVNVEYSQTMTVVGGVAPCAWSIDAGSLPAGLSLDAANGIISGTPTASGAASFTVLASDAQSPALSATRALSITIAPEPPAIGTTWLADGQVGVAYSQTITATGGAEPLAWDISAGSLPVGLSIDASTGEVSGTPTAYGTASFTARIVDSASPANTAEVALSIVVIPADLIISTATLPAGQVAAAYSQTLSYTGGAAPVTWSVTVGDLPTGLSLNASTGEISGTPTAYGLVSFTVQAVDSWTPANTASQALSINVVPETLAVTTTSLPGVLVGVAYSSTLAATNGLAPYAWSVSAGTLPTGLSLNASTGEISGTPTEGGDFPFTVMVTDSWSPANTATKDLSIAVSSGPTYQFVSSDSESSTASTTYVGKTALQFTPPTTDDWIIFGFCEFKCPDVNTATFVQLFVDGVGEGQNTRKPVDPTDYLPFVTVKVKNLAAGPHNIQLMYRTGGSSAAAYVRNARICAIRKASLEFYNVAQDNAQPLTAVLQDMVTLAWTPQIAGSYLVISTAEINATTAVSTDLQSLYNGVLNDEGLMRAADNGDYTTFMSFNYLANAPAGTPITHKIAGKKLAADPINHYIRRARILALKLSGNRFREAAISFATERSTTETSFQQALTMTWTYGASGNWLFLNGARVQNASASCQTEVRAQLNDNPAYICAQQLMRPKDVTDLLNFSSIDVRKLTAPRQVDMDFRTTRTTSSAGNAKVKRLRFYGLPLDAQ
jgi:hypothetical protein